MFQLNSQIFFIVSAVTLFFWALHCIRRTLFFLYFGQIKEYRLDRLLEEIGRRKKIIFSKFFFIALFLLFFWLISLKSKFWPEILTSFFYVLFGLYSLLLFFRRRWIFPRFTKKMIVLFSFAIMVLGLLVWQFLSSFFLFVLLLEVFFPLFIFFCLRVVEVPAFFAKRLIIERAKEKIKNLPELVTIGITGSYGKTSTKEILYRLLIKKNKVLETNKHVNTEMGVAKTVLRKITKEENIFVCEMAAYKKGEVGAICNIVHPRIGILTGINEQHLALFGSQKNIIQGKYELIESLPENGLSVFNGENKYCLELYKKTKKRKKIYGLRSKIGDIVPDVWAEDIKIGKESSSFKVVCKEGESLSFKIRLLGRHSILNVLGAVCVAKEMGISLSEISQICAELRPELGGMVVKRGIKGTKIIDSSYSANPDGVISALDYLRVWRLSPVARGLEEKAIQTKEGRPKLVVVMPCLIELGKASKGVHRMIGRKIAQVCDLAIITTKDEIKEIKEGAKEASSAASGKIVFLNNSQEIVRKISEFCQLGDVILLEGRVPSKLIEKLIVSN